MSADWALITHDADDKTNLELNRTPVHNGDRPIL